jgi:hypothetical protein
VSTTTCAETAKAFEILRRGFDPVGGNSFHAEGAETEIAENPFSFLRVPPLLVSAPLRVKRIPSNRLEPPATFHRRPAVAPPFLLD